MKIGISIDELYPVYWANRESAFGYINIEATEEDLKRWEAAQEAFGKYQDELEARINQAGTK